MASKAKAPKDLMGILNFYLVDKAPVQLPENVKDWIVKAAPWITLVVLILALPVILLTLGISATVLPFSGIAGDNVATGLGLAIAVLILQVGLMAASLPGLFNRKRQGWTLVFYGEIVSLVHSLLVGNILSGLIGALIGLYFLFQIRSYYR